MRFFVVAFLLLVGWAGAPQAENPALQFAELGDLELVGGDVLEDVRLGYRTAGELNADGSNAILFPTWFGGTSEQLLGVWSPWIDTDRFFLVVVDALGNGVSTSPSNSAAHPGRSFPQIGIRDMVLARAAGAAPCWSASDARIAASDSTASIVDPLLGPERKISPGRPSS